VALLLVVSTACKGKPNDLSTEQLSRVVEAQRPGLKRCYDTALEANPYKQEMRMQAVIHVAASGRVSSVKLQGGGGLPGMADCIRTAIRAWQFPSAKDPTDTSLPLIFHPEIAPPQPNLDTLRQALQQVGARP
jgi:hypothetical protein